MIVLLDFFAKWCAPCKMQSPIMDWIAKEYEGKVEVKKIDVDENGALTSKYMVYNLPAIFLEKDGKVVGKWSGLTSRDVLLKAIAEAA